MRSGLFFFEMQGHPLQSNGIAMSKLSSAALDSLAHMSALLQAEERYAREEAAKAREGKSERNLEAEGTLCRKARLDAQRGALFGRVRADFVEDPARPGHLDLFEVRPGSTVRIREKTPEGQPALGAMGVVVRKSPGRFSVVFDDTPNPEDPQSVSLMRTDDDVTLRRMAEAISQAKSLEGTRARLLEVVLGVAAPKSTRAGTWTPLDEALHDDQKTAVEHGVFSEEVALVHGPPGTGKTRVLVEIVRQCVARGEKVLCLTASNTAVDHLALSLLQAAPDLSLARAGHPARVHPLLESHTLAGLTDQHERRKLANKLLEEAFELLRGARRRSDRGRDAWRREREARAEAGKLFADARRLERQAVDEVLRTTQILCGTLTGYQKELRDDARFDVLVVDEASQVLSPALLLGVLRAGRVVLAGDHRQLPPTVLSPQAAKGGLAETAFERLIEQDSDGQVSHMLRVQHRMHPSLMHFPSREFYHERLLAHESVKAICLEDVVSFSADQEIIALPKRNLDIIDTAGAAMEERQNEGTESRDNPGEAKIIEKWIRLLLSLGVASKDVGVVTPYAAQVAHLNQSLAECVAEGLEIDSVDGFQGREKDVILVSAVRSNASGEVGFLSDARRLNVAMTRAKRKLVVVGDSATLSQDPLWNRFFAEAIENGFYRSVFELPEDGWHA